jgi:cytosolic carboxypeptidase protein 2/3
MTMTVLNFTKRSALYHQGMRISVKNNTQDWHKDGICISYRPSRLNKTEDSKLLSKKYYEMSFTYDFRNKNDTVYFAYCIPYTFSNL